MVSIVIPAHNEAPVIGRLIGQILLSSHSGEFEIIVVANGCTDNTAEVAAGISPFIQVISIPIASKSDALAVGNRMATSFPRLYVDADVELGGEDIRILAEALSRPGVLCAGPERAYQTEGRRWQVRWYYSIWTRLPEVRRGMFGRGVIGVSAEGLARMETLPTLMADDLAASLAFSPEERMIAPGAHVLIHPPRTFGDLLRGRTRAVMGADEVEAIATGLNATARTRMGDIVKIVCRAPHRAPQAALFLGVALLARSRARRLVAKNGYTTWLRDESSRQVMAGAADVEKQPAGSSHGR
jgi:glycosyltransferase involved in cell wall biosynthesis